MKKAMICLSLLLFSACGSNHNWQDRLAATVQAGDNGLRMELTRLPLNAADSTSLVYRVRLYPAGAAGEMPTDTRNGLNYRMDSCFTIVTGKRAQLPQMVQAVNNGIAGCFEYLATFDFGRPMRSQELTWVYSDKFINGKSYRLKLN